MSNAFNTLMNTGRAAPLLPWTPPAPPAAIAAPAYNPAPVYNPAPAYSAPAPAYYGGSVPSPAQRPAAINSSPAAPAAPPPPPPKPKLTEADINKMAEVDSTFMDQKSAYANALKKFIADNDRQSKVLKTDSDVALKGIDRNRTLGLTGLSEDFASRGLANSGMFSDSLDKADTQYTKQKENVTTGLTNSQADLAFRKDKFVSENGENGTNIQAARREAYARLAAAQNLT